MTRVGTASRTQHVIVPDVRSRMLDAMHTKQKELTGVRKEIRTIRGTLMRAMLTPAASQKLQHQLATLTKKQTTLEHQIANYKKNPLIAQR